MTALKMKEFLRPTLTILCISVLLFFSGSLSGQSPVDGFYKGKGTFEAGLGVGGGLFGNFYAGYDRIALTRNTVYAAVFLAAGITNNLDIYGSVPYVAVNSESGLQDGSIYLKYRFLNSQLSSGNISVGLALGFSDNLSNYNTESGSAIGQQAAVIDIRPVIQYYRNSGWFYTAQGAYLQKSDPTPAAANAALKVGKATSVCYFDFYYNYQYSFGGLNYRGTPAPDSFRQLGVGYHKVGGTYYRPISDRLGAYAGTSYVLTGRNVGQGPTLNLGVVYKTGVLVSD